MPAAEHTNYHFSSKQISQKMHTRDIFSILYCFIISQFSTSRPNGARQDLLCFYIYPFNNTHLHVYFLHFAASSNLSAKLQLQRKQIMLSIIRYYHFTVALMWKLAIYRTNARGGCYNTTIDHIQDIDKVPAHCSHYYILIFSGLIVRICNILGLFHYDKASVYWPYDMWNQHITDTRNDSGLNVHPSIYLRTTHLFSHFYRLCNYQTWGNSFSRHLIV